MNLLPQWEKEAGREFLIHGERVVDAIQDAIEAKEAAKEAKKVCLSQVVRSKLMSSALDKDSDPPRLSKPLLHLLRGPQQL